MEEGREAIETGKGEGGVEGRERCMEQRNKRFRKK